MSINLNLLKSVAGFDLLVQIPSTSQIKSTSNQPILSA